MNFSYGIISYLSGHVHILDPVFDVLEILSGEGSCMHIFVGLKSMLLFWFNILKK